jgi:hypothetical protein
LVTELQRAVDPLAASPLAGRAVEKDVRWWLVKRFPSAGDPADSSEAARRQIGVAWPAGPL